MNVLILNTNNNAGGASKACYRLHASYRKRGIPSKLLINDEPPAKLPDAYNFRVFQYQQHVKETNTIFKKALYKFDYKRGANKESKYDRELAYQDKILAARPPALEVFTFSNSINEITEHPLYKEADIIHLHWVAAHYIDYSFYQKNTKPIVWTLHDTNPFTGGCHYTDVCTKYQADCHDCPQLQGTINSDYSFTELGRKLEGFKNVKESKVAIVSPSTWLMEESKKSKLLGRFYHYVIPYGIDGKVYKPRDKEAAKRTLGLPTNKKVILFVAYLVDNIRKGYTILKNALDQINKDEYVVCTVGAVTNDPEAFHGIDVYELGFIQDELLLSIAYNAGDMFIIPSLADNLPNTVLESLMCGTPVIAFPVGGIPDMVQHGENGLLSKNVTAAALAESIMEFKEYESKFDQQTISRSAFAKYEEQVQVNAYQDLYKQLLNA